MDLMKVGKKKQFFMVYQDAKFSAPSFLRGESSADVRNTFVLKWVARYVGYPVKREVGLGNTTLKFNNFPHFF